MNLEAMRYESTSFNNILFGFFLLNVQIFIPYLFTISDQIRILFTSKVTDEGGGTPTTSFYSANVCSIFTEVWSSRIFLLIG